MFFVTTFDINGRVYNTKKQNRFPTYTLARRILPEVSEKTTSQFLVIEDVADDLTSRDATFFEKVNGEYILRPIPDACWMYEGKNAWAFTEA